MSLDRRFAEAMGDLLGPEFPARIGIAVSGGGDSMAMLYLAHNWARVWGVSLSVCTVDHGLRTESAAEAAMVAGECAALGWPHATLRWHWDGAGNKMDAARRGRLELIGRWRGEIGHVLMAHTRDDVAETFLMRLARGSGVEGLSAMAARRQVGGAPGVPADRAPERAEAGYEVLRPCLGMTRAELRHYLTVLKGRWVEDPSNDDPAYDRARIRKALPLLAELGLDVDTLSSTAGRMARARTALWRRALGVWDACGHEGRHGGFPTGEILFERSGFQGAERDTQLRLLAAALCYIPGAGYRPRTGPLEALLDRLLGGGGGTLHGCEARMERDCLRVFREYKAVAGLVVPQGAGLLWDRRWRMGDPDRHAGARAEIRALGEDGWAQLPDRPEGGLPYHAARSLPALWQGPKLLACDAMGMASDTGTQLWPMGRAAHSFKAFLMSH